MFTKLEGVSVRYEDLKRQLENPNISDNPSRLREILKEISDLEDLVASYREYKKIVHELEASKSILADENDEDLRDLAKIEISQLDEKRVRIEDKLKILLLPPDPFSTKNIILEIRAGAGGDEAGLFAEQLYRAYCHYASKMGWTVEMLSFSSGNVGGAKEIVAAIDGDKVYSRLKYESGVHRVQRVPKTESQGRVHTSTVTVAIMPEADEVDVKIDPNELRVDVYRSSGHGGQSVNTTDSAVRIIHLPTNTVVTCQDEKSQLKNKNKAMKILYARLLAREQERARAQMSTDRLAQIGTGDRSERIRTYNFPQSRITDHRIGLTLHNLDQVMGGALEDIIDPLTAHYQAEALRSS